MRASASLSFDDGISTSSWNAVFAFRRRVSMSAIGSVIMSAPTSSPRRLGHARHLAGVDHGAEADPAEAEALVHRARAATAAAPRVPAHLELRRALLLLDESLLGHVYCSASTSLLPFAALTTSTPFASRAPLLASLRRPYRPIRVPLTSSARRGGTGNRGRATGRDPGRRWCPW